MEQPKSKNSPEIDDDEFDKREAEVNKLLADLLEVREAAKIKAKEEQQAQKAKSESQSANEEEQVQKVSDRISDPMDALGDNNYVREFLSILSIKTASDLLNAKSGAIAKDLEAWRNEMGMKPLVGTGYVS